MSRPGSFLMSSSPLQNRSLALSAQMAAVAAAQSSSASVSPSRSISSNDEFLHPGGSEDARSVSPVAAMLDGMSIGIDVPNGKRPIKLNVGGLKYATTLDTLLRDPSTTLATMFSKPEEIALDDEGNFFLDRDGELFRYILNWLRDQDPAYIPSKEASLIKMLMKEAEHFNIASLSSYLRSLREKMAQLDGRMKRRDVVRLINERAFANSKVPLNLSGENLSGCDLSFLSLAGAHLEHSNLEGADLSFVDLSGAYLSGASLCAAILKGANLSDSILTRATMRGCDLTAINLTNSTLRGVDLKGVCLKQAVMEKANLSQCDLEGANMESARLSKAQFNEANLQGAVLVDAVMNDTNFHSANMQGVLYKKGALADANITGAKFS